MYIVSLVSCIALIVLNVIIQGLSLFSIIAYYAFPVIVNIRFLLGSYRDLEPDVLKFGCSWCNVACIFAVLADVVVYYLALPGLQIGMVLIVLMFCLIGFKLGIARDKSQLKNL